jgi:hypothetical protein
MFWLNQAGFGRIGSLSSEFTCWFLPCRTSTYRALQITWKWDWTVLHRRHLRWNPRLPLLPNWNWPTPNRVHKPTWASHAQELVMHRPKTYPRTYSFHQARVPIAHSSFSGSKGSTITSQKVFKTNWPALASCFSHNDKVNRAWGRFRVDSKKGGCCSNWLLHFLFFIVWCSILVPLLTCSVLWALCYRKGNV